MWPNKGHKHGENFLTGSSTSPPPKKESWFNCLHLRQQRLYCMHDASPLATPTTWVIVHSHPVTFLAEVIFQSLVPLKNGCSTSQWMWPAASSPMLPHGRLCTLTHYNRVLTLKLSSSSCVNPSLWMIFICLTSVLLPLSPAPTEYNTGQVRSSRDKLGSIKQLPWHSSFKYGWWGDDENDATYGCNVAESHSKVYALKAEGVDQLL